MKAKAPWWMARSDNVTGNYHVGKGDKAYIAVAGDDAEHGRALAVRIRTCLNASEGDEPDTERKE